MPKFDVHVYPVVRISVRGVEAETPQKAARQILLSLDVPAEIAAGNIVDAESIDSIYTDLLDAHGDFVPGESHIFHIESLDDLGDAPAPQG